METPGSHVYHRAKGQVWRDALLYSRSRRLYYRSWTTQAGVHIRLDAEPSGQSGFGGQVLQRRFRPRAIMRNHFGGGEGAQPGAIGQAFVMRQGIEKSGGE